MLILGATTGLRACDVASLKLDDIDWRKGELRIVQRKTSVGISLPLTIGDHAYGKYRWSIVSHKIKFKQFDRVGNVIGATVSVELQEYLRS